MNENHLAIDIASETRKLFPPGCTVHRPDQPERHGVVEQYGMGGMAVYGFNALSCLKIRWGKNKVLESVHRDFVERLVLVSTKKSGKK